MGNGGRGGNADGRTGGTAGIAGRGFGAFDAFDAFDGAAGRVTPPNGAGRPGPEGGMLAERNGACGVLTPPEPEAGIVAWGPGDAGEAGAAGRIAGGVIVAADVDRCGVAFAWSLLGVPDDGTTGGIPDGDAGRSTIAVGSVIMS